METYTVSHRANTMTIEAVSPQDAAEKVVVTLANNTDYFNIIGHKGPTVDMRVSIDGTSCTVTVTIPTSYEKAYN